MVLGYKWDGKKCVLMGGCGCSGDDCNDIFDGKLNCQVANYSCLGLSLCGGPDNLTCTDDEYCEGGGENVYSNEWFVTGCGEPGSLGICKQRPTKCPEEGDDSTPTPCCGCDGNYYESYCEAHLAGTDVAFASSNGVTRDDCER